MVYIQFHEQFLIIHLDLYKKEVSLQSKILDRGRDPHGKLELNNGS